MKILLYISYLGTNYCGYQVQPNGVSVQQKLNEAAKQVFGYDCDIVGCSRTDSGVHADEFCATVTKRKENGIVTNIPVERIPLAMSNRLPRDISVYAAREVDESFHPRYDVRYKEYVYKIWNATVRNPFWEGRAWHLPKHIDETAFKNMQKAAVYFVGKHDFASFMSSDSKVSDTVREVFDSEVTRQEDIITFRVRADGFLYNMVRIFTGTLVNVAYGNINADDIPGIIASGDRRNSGVTAPPHGLYLHKVVYAERGGTKTAGQSEL